MDIKHNSVVALFLAGKSNSAIKNELKHLKVNKMFVSGTIKRYNDTGSVKKRYGGGRKKSATVPENIHKAKLQIQRNPRQNSRKTAKETKISDRCIRGIMKDHLHIKPYKIQKVHALNIKQKKLRLERARELKRLAANEEFPNIVFSDEQIFTIEQFVNKQNNRVWVRERSNKNFDMRLATGSHYPAQVMVWAAVTADLRSPLVFLEPGVKVNATNYREMVLEAALKPWAQKHFGSRPWTFQQDSAPSHKA